MRGDEDASRARDSLNRSIGRAVTLSVVESCPTAGFDPGEHVLGVRRPDGGLQRRTIKRPS